MDKFFSMRIFKEVIDRGGFARAADYLEIAPAAVTRHIAALEKQLGTPLLIRTTRSVALTERGEIYLQRIRSILTDVEEADTAVGAASTVYSGVLKISVPIIYGLYYLPALLLEFRKEYPKVQFDIMLTDDAVDFVTTGREVSLVLREHVTHPDTVTRTFGSAQTVLCATSEYLKQSPPLSRINDLENHCGLAVKSPTIRSDTWQLRSEDGQLVSFQFPQTIVCDSVAMVYQCVLNGLGIGRLPLLLVADAISRGVMVRVLGTYESLDVELVLAWPGKSYVTSKARAFIDFISKNVPN